MWNFITEPGLATATADFTSDLSLLGIGLVSMVMFATGAITLAAARHYVSQRTKPRAETAFTPAGHCEAV